MKKILSALIAATAVAGFASAASANGAGNVVSGSGGANSVHTGPVNPSCSFAITDGTLSGAPVLPQSINSSGAPGTISTVCNSTLSTLDVSLGAVPASNPAQGATATYYQNFGLNTGSGAYAAVNVPLAAPGTASSAAVQIVNLSNGMLSAPSTVNVVAQASVDSAHVLAATAPGAVYTVNVLATVTP
jgi:hypothetical protein